MRKKGLKFLAIGMLVLTVSSFAACGLVSALFDYLFLPPGGEGYGTPERIENITGLTLPKELEVLYTYKGVAFTGLAEQYSVYKLKEEPKELLNSEFSYKEHSTDEAFITETFTLSYERDSEFEKRFQWLSCHHGDHEYGTCYYIYYGNECPYGENYSRQDCDFCTQTFGSFYPDWEDTYGWYRNEIFTALYYPDALVLAIYIHGH